MKKTVIIYARQSIGDEVKSESVEDQIDSCRKLADKNDWQVLEVFKDLDQSGSTYPAGSESFAASDRRWLAYCKDNKHVGQTMAIVISEQHRLFQLMPKSYRKKRPWFGRSTINSRP